MSGLDQKKSTSGAVARRTWLGAAAAATVSGAVLSCGRQAVAQTPPGSESESRNRGEHSAPTTGPVAVQPLPFDPAKLSGLSERLIVSHHDNNYGGAVKKLNSVEQRLAHLGSDAPGYLLGGLQAKRLAFENSVVLHELYFENLGGNGELGPATRKAIEKEFGGLAFFESRFTAVGQSLAGGSGWALLSYHLPRRRLSIDIAADHTQTGANSVVLLALDMYEHSYQMDFGAEAARYIEAFMNNIQGEAVEKRLARAVAMQNVR